MMALGMRNTLHNSNVKVPDSLYKNLQALAEQDGISVARFIATAANSLFYLKTTLSSDKSNAIERKEAEYGTTDDILLG